MNLKDLFLGLQHVGLPTDRYEETISFYHRIGFETYDTEINGASRVCFLRLNDLILEVYECSACTQQTGAWDHIAINVCDIDAAFEYVTSEMPLQPTCVQKLPFFERGVRFFVITGPNGERVEFNQYFTDSGFSPNGMKLFERNAGGAPGNMLVAAARFGRSVAFLGKVGDDMHGRFLKEVLVSEGICTDGMLLDPSVFTTLAFVSLDEFGERTFSFARKPGADTCLRQEELSVELLHNCRVFHFGSISLTSDPVRSATLSALKTAKTAGAVISYDPNFRENLWPDTETARMMIRSVLQSVDFVKVSEEELEIVTGETDAEKACVFLHKKGITCVVVTLGEKGAYISLKGKGVCQSAGLNLGPIVDKTGAGDAFWGTFIAEFTEEKIPLSKLKLDDVRRYADCANIAAALSITRRGGIPSMPRREEIVGTILQMKGNKRLYEA